MLFIAVGLTVALVAADLLNLNRRAPGDQARTAGRTPLAGRGLGLGADRGPSETRVRELLGLK